MITYTYEVEVEDEDYRNYFSDDLEAMDHIQKTLDKNPLVWCRIEMTAHCMGLTGDLTATSYLGCCSYESKEDMEACPAFQKLMEEARIKLGNYINSLNDKMRETQRLYKEKYGEDESF